MTPCLRRRRIPVRASGRWAHAGTEGVVSAGGVGGTRGAVVLAAVTLLLAFPAGSGAQQDRMERVRETFPEQIVERLSRVVAEAERDGVPVGPVLDKALEGAAKGVPAERVVPAVSRYADRLRRAIELVGEAGGQDAVVAGADALQRGAPPEAVRTVAAAEGRAVPGALVLLGDLAEAGVPGDGAVELVTTALERGRRGESLLGLSAVVRGLVRRGTPPERAARAVVRTLRGDEPPGDVPPVELPPSPGGATGPPRVPGPEPGG